MLLIKQLKSKQIFEKWFQKRHSAIVWTLKITCKQLFIYFCSIFWWEIWVWKIQINNKSISYMGFYFLLFRQNFIFLGREKMDRKEEYILFNIPRKKTPRILNFSYFFLWKNLLEKRTIFTSKSIQKESNTVDAQKS